MNVLVGNIMGETMFCQPLIEIVNRRSLGVKGGAKESATVVIHLRNTCTYALKMLTLCDNFVDLPKYLNF